jgi:hypothetical protein
MGELATESEFKSQWDANFLISRSSDLIWGPSSPLYNGYQGTFLRRASKQPGLEADHSPPTTAKVKKIRIHPFPHTSPWQSAEVFEHRDILLFLLFVMNTFCVSFVLFLAGSTSNFGDIPFKGRGRLLPAQKSIPQQPACSRCCPNRPLHVMPDRPHGEYKEMKVIYLKGARIRYYCALPEEKFA